LPIRTLLKLAHEPIERRIREDACELVDEIALAHHALGSGTAPRARRRSLSHSMPASSKSGARPMVAATGALPALASCLMYQ
jgi:hypothetical protein